MAKNEAKRLAPGALADDEESFNALKKVDGYTPSNANYTVEAIQQARDDKQAAQAAEDQAAATLRTARDVATSKEWIFHNLILGAKDHVRGHLGPSSGPAFPRNQLADDAQSKAYEAEHQRVLRWAEQVRPRCDVAARNRVDAAIRRCKHEQRIAHRSPTMDRLRGMH